MRRALILASCLAMLYAGTAAVVGFGLIPPALAQTAQAPAPASALDLRPLLNETVIPLLATVLLSLGVVAIAWLKRRLGIEDNRALGEIADKALVRAVQYAENIARANAQGGWTRVQIENQMARDAAGYVLQQIPGTLKQLGFDPATDEGRKSIDRMIQARLNPAALAEPAARPAS